MRPFFLLLFLLSAPLFAQKAPKFAKYPIGNSGLNIYLPAQPDSVTLAYSPDSSKVYTIESLDSSSGKYYHFGAIVVDLKEKLAGGEEEDMIIAYLDYLKTAFEITESAGYGKGHTLETHPAAKGVIDYWKDKEGDEWRIFAWADTNYVVVMFEYGPGDYPNENVIEIFRKGIRFPGDK